MTPKQLAKAIRTQQQEYTSTVAQLTAALSAIKAQCKHKQVVVVCSEYQGSYSWDYDDGHDEFRQCLICGETESAEKNKFVKLLNPFRRLELGYPYSRHSKYKESPLNNCLHTPLNKLLKWAENTGYQVWPTQ